jgi:uncharacterized membrane protein
LLIPLSIWIALPRLRVKRRTADGRAAADGGRIGRPSPNSHRRLSKQALFALFVRCLLLTSVILALAGLQAVRVTHKLAVAFLIDASDSVGAEGRDKAEAFVREALRAMRADGADQAAVVVFGADAAIERSMSFAHDLAPLGTKIRSSATNVEGAIRLGLSLLPEGAAKRIVLLSDGKQTVGDGDSAARLVRATNTRLDTVVLPSVQGTDAAIDRIDAPQRASVGQVIPLQVVVSSNQAMRAQLTVFAGPDVVAQQSVNLVQGQNEFSLRINATRAGFSSFRVQLAPENDIRPQNNALSSSVIVGGPPRILLVARNSPIQGADAGAGAGAGAGEREARETDALKAALTAAGITFDEVSPLAMPTEIQSLASYQSIVLVNVPARDLSLRAMYSLQSFVRDIGGGLVAIGGPNSYGVGGYYKTPLEQTLPVEMQIKDPRRFPSVAIVIVMDKSGSMGAQENGVLKIRLAAEAAARVAELVNDDDEVSVIGFDTEPVDKIGPFTGAERSKYVPQILKIGPGGGGIYIFDSLKEAEKIIAKTNKLSKFIILLADGSDSEQQDGAKELVRKMRGNDVMLTVVAIGDGSDVPFLKSIAATGGGRFHLTDKAANLPTIFTEETALAQRSYIVERDFFPKAGAGGPILSGIAAMPQLQGYVATTAKPAAQVVLRASESDPLLVTWQYGLGRAVAFTSDATGRWAKAWVNWPEFPKFWAQAIRWTILERTQSAVQARVTQRGEQTLIEADMPNPETVPADTKLTATVIDSEGQMREVNLLQIAPGHFEAETFLDQPGAYFLRITSALSTPLPAGEGNAKSVLHGETTLAWVKPYSSEYAPSSGGEDVLKDWAALGGGEVLSAGPQAFVLNAPAAASRTDLFPYLLALAALLLPFDVGVRRIAVSLRKLLGLGPKLAPAISMEQTGRMVQLMRAKGRVRPEKLSPQARVSFEEDAAPKPTVSVMLGKHEDDTAAEAASNAAATASELLKRRKQKVEGEGAGVGEKPAEQK